MVSVLRPAARALPTPFAADELVRVEQLHYELPPDRIARHPAPRREDARLLVIAADGLEHHRVDDLPAMLPAGALLVVNDTRVLSARLLGHKAGSGGRVEVLLVRRLEQADMPAESPAAGAPCERWSALARASRRLRAGTAIEVGADTDGPPLHLWLERESDDEGLVRVLVRTEGEGDLLAAIERHGHVPLPPYIGRADELADRERYQTVFARAPGAVAAPTAGLHFSGSLLDALRAKGVEVGAITLHVGPGTFRPVSVADLDDHPMHAEPYEVGADLARAVARARQRGAPVIAVGTTVVRALESAADPEHPGQVRAAKGDTRLLIQPGYEFRVVDGLLTNFHLPGSTLLALVYAFGGRSPVASAYRVAIERGYRFYSYGDAMYLPRRVVSSEAAR